MKTLISSFEMYDPLTLLVLAGFIGGMMAVFHDIYKEYFTLRSFIQIIFGIFAAVVAGLINTVQGNAGLFLTGLVAGIGGVAFIGQYVQGKSDIIELTRQIQVNNRQLRTLYHIINIAETNIPPEVAMQEIKSKLREFSSKSK